MNSRFMDESLQWRRLCRAAAVEQDPGKLFQIVQRINAALSMRLHRINGFSHARRNHGSSRLGRALPRA